MAALSADRTTRTKGGPGRRKTYDVVASDIIYKGSLVCLDSSGDAAPGADTSGYKPVVGIALEHVDNSSGSAGDKTVEVYSDIEVLVEGDGNVAAAQLGDTATVADDQTVSEAGTTTNDIQAGTVTEIEAADKIWIYIPPYGAAL